MSGRTEGGIRAADQRTKENRLGQPLQHMPLMALPAEENGEQPEHFLLLLDLKIEHHLVLGHVPHRFKSCVRAHGSLIWCVSDRLQVALKSIHASQRAIGCLREVISQRNLTINEMPEYDP
ncbi:MAG: hypothetical protein ACK4M8_03705, partial [Allorhizobium sp.]